MIPKGIDGELFARAYSGGLRSNEKDVRADGEREKRLPQREGPLFTLMERADDAEPRHGLVPQGTRRRILV